MEQNIKYELKNYNIEELKPHEKNPRKHPKEMIEKLMRSIKDFGFTNPVLIDKDKRILAGHARCEASKKLGIESVPAIMLPLTGAAADAYVIADNKLNELSGWDAALLTSMLKDLEQSGFDLELTGFDLTEVKELFGSGSIENAHEDNFDEEKALEETVKAVTKTGDIWYLGKHRLLCGDCTKPEEIAKLMAGNKADIMVTDPPYNVNYKDTVSFHKNGGYSSSRVVSDIANDNLSDKDFYEFLYGFYSTAYGILKGGAPIYVFHSTKESINFITALKMAGFKLSQTLTWVKNHFTLGRSNYQYITEPILYGWKVAEGCPHYFIDDRTLSNVFEDAKLDIKKLTKDEMRSLLERIFSGLQTDAIRCDKPARSPDHPTMKPIMLCAKLIYNSSHEGDIVYEPFGGSGSTLIASAQLNRICYASEIDARYCDVIAKRYAKEFPNEKIKLLRGNMEIEHSL